MLFSVCLSDDGFGMFAGVNSVSIDVGQEQVLVESALTSAEVQALIESTGRRAVLKGIGGSEQGEEERQQELHVPALEVSEAFQYHS